MNRMAWIAATIFAAVLVAQIDTGAAGLSRNNVPDEAGTADVYFDVTVGEPAKLSKRLELIETTYTQLVASGFSPRVVVGIRGKASNFFTSGNGYVSAADIPIKKDIAARVEKFKTMGYGLEQCAIAADLQKIAVGDFLPQMRIVANGYAAMISYQSQGYAFVPMD